MKTNITIVIPVHEIIAEETLPWFTKAIQSIESQQVKPDEVLIVYPAKSESVNSVLTAYDFGTIKDIVRLVDNPGETDFSSQINYGATQVKTTYFGILELDDELSTIWLKNVVDYIKFYGRNEEESNAEPVDLFLPLVVNTDINGNFLGFTNEPVWANGFSESLGYLDNNTLLTYQNFNITGMVINTEAYKKNGGLKSTIKLTFVYEFLLRLSHFDTKIMVIPKIGYKHTNLRPGSLFYTCKTTMTPDEAKSWLDTAKKEYYFKEERKLSIS